MLSTAGKRRQRIGTEGQDGLLFSAGGEIQVDVGATSNGGSL